MSTQVVTIENLTKIYEMGSEKVEVLGGISLGINRSEMVLLTGESGSGKSTFLNMVGGLDSPTGGKIIVEGTEISALPESWLTQYRRKTIGFVFQFHYLLRDFNALENIMMPLLIAGVSMQKSKERARELLADIGLEKRKDHFPSMLSGGERQRVAVARALINEPLLILADEPTGNLDEKNSNIVIELLFDLIKKYNRTMILVTHDLSIKARADKSYHLVHGKLEKQ